MTRKTGFHLRGGARSIRVYQSGESATRPCATPAGSRHGGAFAGRRIPGALWWWRRKGHPHQIRPTCCPTAKCWPLASLGDRSFAANLAGGARPPTELTCCKTRSAAIENLPPAAHILGMGGLLAGIHRARTGSSGFGNPGRCRLGDSRLGHCPGHPGEEKEPRTAV